MPSAQPGPLGLLIRRFRRNAALSQEELAARSGVSARAISDLERGQRVAARFETVRMLADALELSPEDRALLIQAAQAPMIDITLRQPRVASHALQALPAPLTPLVGRHRELKELAGILTPGEVRLITLTGPGGVGKTRLALAAASEVAERFAGNVGWIDLSPTLDTRAVIPAIATELGIVETDRQPEIGDLKDFFADRRFLLVLDNFEHVIEAATILSDLLAAAPRLTVLVTSRAPLRLVAEIEYPISPLELPESDASPRDIEGVEAVRLLVERTQAVRRDFALTPENAEAVAKICRRLEGLPLAIELAAARGNILSPKQLLDRLDQRLPLLTRGPRNAPLRQQTMRDTIAWSYNLLDSESQWLFRRVSVFVGGFTIDTVEWLAESRRKDSIAAINALATLVENNLIFPADRAPDSTRFSMFETIREYGYEQLTELQELEEAHDLLGTYCLSLARHGEGIPTCIVPEPWVTMVDRERSNIRAAFHNLVSSGNRAAAFEFATAFGHYLYNRGPVDEAWSWYEHVLDAPKVRPEIRLQGLYWASHLASHLRNFDRAEALANEALAIAEEVGDTSWRASIVHCQALIQLEKGCADQAEALFNEELTLWKKAGVQGLSGFAYMLLGSIAFARGDVCRAREMEDKAESILSEMGGLAWVGLINWHRGVFSISEGIIDDAAAHFLESVRLAGERKASLIQHLGLVGLAWVASAVGLHEAAGQLVGAAERSFKWLGNNLGGTAKSLYDQTIFASQNAIGSDAFDACRQRGSGSNFADWIRIGESVRRAATQPVSESGARNRALDSMVNATVIRELPELRSGD